jgi:hypothetical protein
VNCCVLPRGREGFAGVIVTLDKAAAPTVSVVELLNVPSTALIVVAPVASVLANPVELVVATVALEELQVTTVVRVSGLPLERFPMTANCCGVPLGTVLFVGDTTMEVIPVVVPVPVRFTVCGELLASSVKASVPGRAPSAFGWNATVTVQLLVAGTVVPHELL